jgi:Leucine-rich repeat (LRR) protein
MKYTLPLCCVAMLLLLSTSLFAQTQNTPVKYKLLINDVACSNFELVKNHPEDVQSIEIELRNGNPLPKEIFSFTQLKKLIIRDLEGEFLSGNFSVFSQLQELMIEDCDDLLTLPESIGKLTSLKILDVKENFSLVNIPESVYELVQLEKLTFPISSDRMPESIGKLTQLTELAIEFHKKKNDNWIYVPDDITQLTSLKSVELYALGLPNKTLRVAASQISGSARVKSFLQPFLTEKK